MVRAAGTPVRIPVVVTLVGAATEVARSLPQQVQLQSWAAELLQPHRRMHKMALQETAVTAEAMIVVTVVEMTAGIETIATTETTNKTAARGEPKCTTRAI